MSFEMPALLGKVIRKHEEGRRRHNRRPEVMLEKLAREVQLYQVHADRVVKGYDRARRWRDYAAQYRDHLIDRLISRRGELTADQLARLQMLSV